jgi:phosphomannomutase
MGFATDGDGDRIGAVDERGRFIDAQHIFALLLELLAAEKEWTGLVVKTFAVTDLVDRLAEAHGLPVKRTPVGFKYVCELALERTMLIGGEESGGIGVKNHIPERDGLLCALFLAELAVRRQQPLSVLVEQLHETYGIHTYRRVDLELEPAVKNRLMKRLEADPPQSFAGREVAEIDSLDGFRFELAGGGWILMRPSGTEPVVRLYAEAGGRGELEELLESAQAFVNEAAHG